LKISIKSALCFCAFWSDKDRQIGRQIDRYIDDDDDDDDDDVVLDATTEVILQSGDPNLSERGSRSGGRYLVMGKKQRDQLIVSYVRSLDRQRSRDLARAMRSIRRQAGTLCAQDEIHAAFASAASPPYRAKSRNENNRKEKGGGKRARARSNNEMAKTGRRSRKHKRRSSPAAEIETET